VDELKAKGWNRVKQELEDSQVQLVNLLSEKTDAFLENEYEPKHTYEFVIEGTSNMTITTSARSDWSYECSRNEGSEYFLKGFR
jgi:hypothetical protein